MSSAAPSTSVAPQLVEEFTIRADLKPPVDAGAGPFGHRMIFEVSGGRAEGARISAELLTGGGDWVLVGPDGFGRIDVRIQFRCDDGAVIYSEYHGLIEKTEAVGRALTGGGETRFTDQYFRTTPRFETGDERYGWLTRRVFVAQGRILPGAVEYRVFRVD
jgi:hypothetical protein